MSHNCWGKKPWTKQLLMQKNKMYWLIYEFVGYNVVNGETLITGSWVCEDHSMTGTTLGMSVSTLISVYKPNDKPYLVLPLGGLYMLSKRNLFAGGCLVYLRELHALFGWCVANLT